MSFYFFATMTVGSAILMVTRRNVLHAVICFITTLLATAGIFLQLHAEFLFIVQIFLFIGGIMALFVFAGLLSKRDVATRLVKISRGQFVALALAFVLAVQIFFAIFVGRTSLRLPAMQTDISPMNSEAIGDALFHQFIVPVEIGSILLLVAMIGTVVMARRRA
jgi:NADH-quinone oxidoreductase subunit J